MGGEMSDKAEDGLTENQWATIKNDLRWSKQIGVNSMFLLTWQVAGMIAEVDRLRADNARLHAALAQYADDGNWKFRGKYLRQGWWNGGGGGPGLAREALGVSGG